MKDKYLLKFGILKSNLPVYEFYSIYIEYYKDKEIKLLTKVVILRTLLNKLEIISIQSYINEEQVRACNITYDKLCKKFLNKNWIYESDEIDGINIPKTFILDPKTLDQFLIKIYSTNIPSSDNSQNKMQKNK